MTAQGLNNQEFSLQFLHPEMMSIEGIKSVLVDRCIHLRNMNTMSKEELVAVFHRVAVPQSQRNCFRKKSHQQASLDVRVTTNSLSNELKRDTNASSARLSNCINYGKKTIRLRENPETSKSKVARNEVVTMGSSEITSEISAMETSEDDTKLKRKEVSAGIESPKIPPKRARIAWP
ncbi:uncharacterized protein LOC135934253 [Cloeon dipterum]|uniref:uncharacterized protein LOC135934253 n=1 Tax=Cloeon dipterum TaxID=197152 RepID=UPI00321FB9D9